MHAKRILTTVTIKPWPHTDINSVRPELRKGKVRIEFLKLYRSCEHFTSAFKVDFVFTTFCCANNFRRRLSDYRCVHNDKNGSWFWKREIVTKEEIIFYTSCESSLCLSTNLKFFVRDAETRTETIFSNWVSKAVVIRI